jgi:AcrR family transcriptional regulator
MSSGGATKEDVMQEQILQAAKRLFAVYGLSKVTMDDVAKAIGKGRSSLYYYYKSKEEIFDAVFTKEIQEMLAFMQRAINHAATTEEKIKAFCVAKLEVQREKQIFFSTLDAGMDADALSQFHQVKIRHHHQIIKQENALVEQIFEFGISKGQLRKISKREQEQLIYVLLCSLHGIKRELRLGNNYDNIELVVHTFTQMVMYGLSK